MQREKNYANLNQIRQTVGEKSSGPERKGMMGEMVFEARVRRRVRALWLGLTLSAMVTQLGYAQDLQSYSALNPGSSNLTGLPGQNVAQQMMAQSINNFCPTVANIATTPGQTALKGLCGAMIGNALQVLNQPANSGLGTPFTLDANGLNNLLQQLNGGAELLVPTSQASVVQTTQTSRQTGAIEERLKELRDWTTGSTLAGAESPRLAQVASLNTREPGDGPLLAQNQPLEFAYSTGPFGVFVSGLGQFGSRDQTTTETGYSFNNAGFIAGADYRFTPQLIAGLAFGYTQSNTNFDTSALSASGQSLNGNLLQGNLYATYSVTDALYVNAIGFIGGGNNNSQRHIVLTQPNASDLIGNGIATGSFGSRIAGFTLAGGYDLPYGAFVLTPIARFLYQHTGVDAFSEEGALGADLAFGSSSVSTVLTFLGADAQYTMPTPFGVLFPIARFHWAHQYSPSNTAVSVAYSNDSSSGLLSNFILPGTPTSRNYFDLGVGVTLPFSSNGSAFINYDAILGINNTTYNSFTAGVRFTF
jgi:outer membrane autotransporter protein